MGYKRIQAETRNPQRARSYPQVSLPENWQKTLREAVAAHQDVLPLAPELFGQVFREQCPGHLWFSAHTELGCG